MDKDNILIINDNKIELEYSIKQALVFDDTIIVLSDNEEISNNIIAYNEQGTELWRINDILKIEEIGNFTEIEKVSDNVMGAYYVWGIYFEIDIKRLIVLKKEYIK